MQSDPAVISLRPGGGNRGSRTVAPRFDTAVSGGGATLSSSDLPVLRPHGGAAAALLHKIGDSRFERHERISYTRLQLLQIREVC
ncbi:hypothetical protein Cni_G01345 [Canna indica]|uniref:Uncharacterized protein n=1 Tax=Canna indica TaxID=4628 RepID=A0AAQ3JPB6_9LILI|nr:hypothetical protein Cni_G01345 [Canna indica]